MVIQHGPPGDSKSVMLWLVCQILYYYAAKTYEERLAEWSQNVAEHKQARKTAKARAKKRAEDGGDESEDSDAPPAPKKPDKPDHLLNRGTWVGTGQFLEKENGAALLGLHEGKGWLCNTMDGGVGGGVEDLNQVMDHDVYKNSPANATGKFNVRNVHLPGIVLMHLQELFKEWQKDDSVVAMMRFLVCKFPSVVNKILLEGLDDI